METVLQFAYTDAILLTLPRQLSAKTSLGMMQQLYHLEPSEDLAKKSIVILKKTVSE